MTGSSSTHNTIFNSTENDKKGSFEGEQVGSNDISIEKADEVEIEKDSISYSSSKIKTEISENNTSSENIGNNHPPIKRSISHNLSSLPAKKRLKLNNSFSLCQEEEKPVCKVEEFSKSEGEEEESIYISGRDELDQEELEEARRNRIIVMEHQAFLRRKIAAELYEASKKDSLVAEHQALMWRKFAFDEPTEEEPEELDGEELDEQTEAAIKEARMNVLVGEHQALLQREMGPLDNPIENENRKDCDVPVDYDCTPQHWRSMTVEQKERANRLALKIQTGNPAFVRVLNRFCLTKKSFIVVPKSFSATHLPEENQTFVLLRPEKEHTWSIRYYFRKTHQSIEGSAWVNFVRENNLREGDVCMFELVKSALEVTFTVHISQTV